MPGPRYAWAEWILGLILTFIVGTVLNVVAGFGALASKSPPLAALIGAAPGLLFVGLAYTQRRTAFAQGAIVAAAVLALIGGICGFSLPGARFAG